MILQTDSRLPDALRLSGLQGNCIILNLHILVGRIRRSRRIRHEQSARCQHSETDAKRCRLILQTDSRLPDALRLSGLQGNCIILNLHILVGRIRRSRRIRHEQSARCQHSEADAKRCRLILQTYCKLPDALRLSGLQGNCIILNLHILVGRIRRSRRIRHEQSARCQHSEADAKRCRLILQTYCKLPDALRLSGLQGNCIILNWHAPVGRIRHSRRIRHEQSATLSAL